MPSKNKLPPSKKYLVKANNKYFSFWHIAISSTIATPLAGLYMIVSNFYNDENQVKGLATLIFGIVFILIYLGINSLFVQGLPVAIQLTIPTLLLLFFTHKEQQTIQQNIINGLYFKKNYLAVLIVCLVCWVMIGLLTYFYLIAPKDRAF